MRRAAARSTAAISSIVGLFTETFVAEMKAVGIAWFATATTLGEAEAPAKAGADAVIAQGAEAGGHRGAFDAATAERRLVGLFSLIPAIVDHVEALVIGAGGIADERGVAAALALGASAVSIGTAFLRTPEADIAPAWQQGFANAAPEDCILTRAFSGRLGRSLETSYVKASEKPGAPTPAPYLVQRRLTSAMRVAAQQRDHLSAFKPGAASPPRSRALVRPRDRLLRSGSRLTPYLERKATKGSGREAIYASTNSHTRRRPPAISGRYRRDSNDRIWNRIAFAAGVDQRQPTEAQPSSSRRARKSMASCSTRKMTIRCGSACRYTRTWRG